MNSNFGAKIPVPESRVPNKKLRTEKPPQLNFEINLVGPPKIPYPENSIGAGAEHTPIPKTPINLRNQSISGPLKKPRTLKTPESIGTTLPPISSLRKNSDPAKLRISEQLPSILGPENPDPETPKNPDIGSPKGPDQSPKSTGSDPDIGIPKIRLRRNTDPEKPRPRIPNQSLRAKSLISEKNLRKQSEGVPKKSTPKKNPRKNRDPENPQSRKDHDPEKSRDIELPKNPRL